MQTITEVLEDTMSAASGAIYAYILVFLLAYGGELVDPWLQWWAEGDPTEDSGQEAEQAHGGVCQWNIWRVGLGMIYFVYCLTSETRVVFFLSFSLSFVFSICILSPEKEFGWSNVHMLYMAKQATCIPLLPRVRAFEWLVTKKSPRSNKRKNKFAVLLLSVYTEKCWGFKAWDRKEF